MSDYKMVPVVLSDEACEAVYTAVSIANLTREVKSPKRKREIVREAMLAKAPPFVVTDEIVHIAWDAFYKSHLKDDNSIFDAMRAAIEAVLGGGV